MAVDIGPKIGIDGEKEFRQALQNINQQLKTLGSEMKAVTSSFDEGDRSEEALAAQTGVLNQQIDAQKQKLSQLEKGLAAAVSKYGEADTRTLRWAQAVNDATADLNKMESQLADLDKELNGGFFEKLKAQIIDLTGKDSALGKLVSGGGLGSILGKGLAVGAIVGGVQQLASSMFDLVESTQEYRAIQASLEQSSAAAGYSTAQTAQTYERLQSVLGDQQTAATATANLQAIGLSQYQLMELTDAAIGAWARYGDSIPIDGLAEAINETIQAGTVTGTFADVLNWAGTNEDEFNAKLAEASSQSERANIVLQELTKQGLAESGQAWIENNEDITANNRATDELNAAMARLGEVFAPLVAKIKSLIADGINLLVDKTEDAVDFFAELPERALEWGRDLIDNFVGGIKSKVDDVVDTVKGVAQTVKDYIGFSEPDKGPLSNFHTFAPDMMELFAQGIRENQWRVAKEAEKTANTIKDAITSKIAETETAIAQTQNAAVKESLNEQLAALQEYQSEFENALTEIQNKQQSMSEKLFDYQDLFNTTTDIELGDILEISDLREQIEYINEYGDALEALKQRGTSTEFLDMVAGLDIDDAKKYSEQLLQMTDEQYNEYMSLWEEKQEAARRVAQQFYSSEMSALNEAYQNELAAVESAYSEEIQAMEQTYQQLPEKAVNWGQDLIDGFVSGIKSKAATVKEAVKDIAQTVKDYIGFSEPDKGPLSNFHTFAPDMMQLYSSGIRNNSWRVTDAVDNLAGQMMTSMPAPVTAEDLSGITAGAVNGITAANAGQSFPSKIVLTLENGVEIARWLLPDLRTVQRANPEVVSGV